MAAERSGRPWTVEEYLWLERNSLVKHEYVDGTLRAGRRNTCAVAHRHECRPAARRGTRSEPVPGLQFRISRCASAHGFSAMRIWPSRATRATTATTRRTRTISVSRL